MTCQSACVPLRLSRSWYLPSVVQFMQVRGTISSRLAQSTLRTLIDRLRGETMPEGIAKTNGRIEATQIDVSANI